MMTSASTSRRPRAGERRRVAIAAGLFLVAVAAGLVVLANAQGFPPSAPGGGERLTDVLAATIEAEGIEAAAARYRALRDQGFSGVRESERGTNTLGYRYLGKGETDTAIAIFRLNVETHPGSANVHDSLGEAYLATGDRDAAIASYRRALEIDPKQRSAIVALQDLADHRREPYPFLVIFHILAGAVGLVSGAAAVALRKGSRRHARAGTVFFVSMVIMSTSGAYIAWRDPHGEVINVMMGLLTFYLVATAWRTARRGEGRTDLLDWAGLALVTGLAAGLANFGMAAAARQGGFVEVFFGFGGVALLAALGDLRMIVGGGVSGAGRIARHLWRMLAALFIAVMSLFLGQPQVFPRALRETGLLGVPGLVVVLLLLFWLIRVLLTGAYRRQAQRGSPQSAA